MYCIGVFFLPQERAPKAGPCHLFILFLFFELWMLTMSTLGTIVYNSDLFSDINTINTMAAAVIANYTGKVGM